MVKEVCPVCYVLQGTPECEQAGFPLLLPYQNMEKSPLAQNEEQSGLLLSYKRQYLSVFGSID